WRDPPDSNVLTLKGHLTLERSQVFSAEVQLRLQHLNVSLRVRGHIHHPGISVGNLCFRDLGPDHSHRGCRIAQSTGPVDNTNLFSVEEITQISRPTEFCRKEHVVRLHVGSYAMTDL